jgi:hypothetical protein
VHVDAGPRRLDLVFDVGILRYALGIGSYIVTLVKPGSMATFWWVPLVVDVVLLVLFVVPRSRAGDASA